MIDQLLAALNVFFRLLICIVTLSTISVTSSFGQSEPMPGAVGPTTSEVSLAGAEYDVASIRLSKPSDSGGVRTLPSGEFISNGMALKTTIGTAYGKFSFQIMGGPAWLDS